MKLLIWILFVHFLADFVFQSDDVAKRKSKEWPILLKHVGIYGLVLAAGLGWWYSAAVLYAATNAGLHFLTDAVTSRINSRLYAAGKVHWFFVGIGADQFVHAACLILTLPLLVKP